MTTQHLHQRDLAERWRVSERTLERWRWKRQGPAYLRLTGRVVYRLEDILEYEAAKWQATGTKAEPTLTKPERFARGLPE